MNGRKYRLLIFRADQKKEGGAYVTVAGTIKRLDNVEGILKLEDGTCIKIEDIIKVQHKMMDINWEWPNNETNFNY